jgi:hypothetical protein
MANLQALMSVTAVIAAANWWWARRNARNAADRDVRDAEATVSN